MTLTDNRLMDLVRYARHHLYDEGLITDEEYSALVQHQGAVARLEGYDAAVAAEREACAKIAEEVATWHPARSMFQSHGLQNVIPRCGKQIADAIRNRGKA